MTANDSPVIAQAVARVEERIQAAAERAGRRRCEITLIAVSKTQPATAVAAAWRAGIRDFGENRVQEGAAKRGTLDPLAARWHLLGTLQRNKVRAALRSFDVLQAVDRPEIVAELAREAAKEERSLDLFLEVRLGGEPSKHGVDPERTGELLERVLDHRQLRPLGLMTIPPPHADPEASRPWFRALRELRDRLHEQDSSRFAGWLSMGMSADFEVAIEEGATHVRVGTAIFGSRPMLDSGA